MNARMPEHGRQRAARPATSGRRARIAAARAGKNGDRCAIRRERDLAARQTTASPTSARRLQLSGRRSRQSSAHPRGPWRSRTASRRGASASSRLAEAARRAFEAGNLAEARRALSDPSLESAMVASGDRHRLAHARAVVDFHDGGGSVDELLERLRLAEADARDSAAARAASSPADDVDVDGVAASRAATHAESDAFHDAFALRANLAWALQASGRAAASAEARNPVSRDRHAVAPSAAVRVCAMLVRAARRTGRLERAARVLDRAEAIVTRAEAILPRAAEADATLTDATRATRRRRRRFVRHRAPRPRRVGLESRADAVARRRRASRGDARVDIARTRAPRARARTRRRRTDVSARLDRWRRRRASARDDATKETYLEAFLAETRVLRGGGGDARTRGGRDASVDGRARDVSRVRVRVFEFSRGVSTRGSSRGGDGGFRVDVDEGRPGGGRDDEGRPGGGRARGRARRRRVRGADGRTTRRRGVGVRVARVENPGDVASIGGVRRRARDGGEGGAETREEERYGDVSARRGEHRLGRRASSDSFSRACGCLDVADALFSARARVDGDARARRRRARGGGCESRLRESTPRATSRRPRARRDALAHSCWMGRRRRRERKRGHGRVDVKVRSVSAPPGV